MNHSSVTLGSAVLALALVVTGTDFAAAAELEPDPLSSLVAEAVPDASLTPGAPVAVHSDGAQLTSVSQVATLTIPRDAASKLVVDQHDAPLAVPDLTIGLPTAASSDEGAIQEGQSAVSFADDHAHTVIQPFEDGLRLSTVVEDASAPDRYTYTLPQDVTPVLNADGSATLTVASQLPVDATNDSVTLVYGTVAAPWAVDASGKNVPTHYEVSNGTLTQVVITGSDTKFPVVADPTFWWGWNAFLSNSVHQQVLKALLVVGGVVTAANIIARYIPNAYVQAAAALAGVIAAVGIPLWNACNFNRRGVIVGYTWLASAVPPIPGLTWVRSGYFCLPQ